MLKFECWIFGSRIHIHKFLLKCEVLFLSFHVLIFDSCLSRYLHDLKFYKINNMFRSCVYTSTIMLLKFVQTQNYFTKFSKSEKCCFPKFQADRPTARSTGASARTCTVVHVCRSTAPVDRLLAGLLSVCLGRPGGRPL